MMRLASRSAWPAAAACAVLLCFGGGVDGVAADKPRKACPTMDIRNSVDQFMKLNGCSVVEGNLMVVLMEKTNSTMFEKISFPDLREITGFLIVYRIKGLSSLGQLFPNLSVIRGTQLFWDYALVVHDMSSLTSLGLTSLTIIERGSVHIGNNENLCFANTIDWDSITINGRNNRIKGIKDTRLCGSCPRDDKSANGSTPRPICPVDANGRELCWNENHCQKFCPPECKGACTVDGTGKPKCCDSNCLGGCDGSSARNCHVCRHFAFENGSVCMRRCPNETYEFNRRCITKEECLAMPPPVGGDLNSKYRWGAQRQDLTANGTRTYKTVMGKCVFQCPAGFFEAATTPSSCERCPIGGCVHVCQAGKIDSLDSAEQFLGCTRINGSLEINLRGGGNVMSELENCLRDVKEIDGSLKVLRSYALVSLNFLSNLEKIRGHAPNGSKKQSLYIFDNANLEELWDWSTHKPIEITEGKLFIHLNPKLCYKQIEPLKNMTKDPSSTFDVLEVSQENNGDKAACSPDMLTLSVGELLPSAVMLIWNPYCPADQRRLLGYSIYYTPTPGDHNITTFEGRDACSDSWSVIDHWTDSIQSNLKSNPLFNNTCEGQPPLYKLITYLASYTRYAAYVKTYTTQQDKGAQSPIIYFKTLPGQPSSPYISMIDHLDAHSVILKWDRPSRPNGTLVMYRVQITLDDYNSKQISQFNYCTHPVDFTNVLALREDETQSKDLERTTGEVTDENCHCSKSSKPGNRFTSGSEAAEYNNFEDALQNMLFVKSLKKKQPPRIRRSAIDTNNVIMYGEHSPKFANSSIDNKTNGFIKTFYVEVNANLTSLKISNLRHYSWYTVSLYACREKHPQEKDDMYNKSQCSERSSRVFRTWEIPDADIVTNLHAEILPSNKTAAEVNVTWDAPKLPNGLIIAFDMKYTHIENEVTQPNCITYNTYLNNSGGCVLKNIPPGNYSIRVSVVSMNGTSTYAAETFIFIPERTSEGMEWVWGVVVGCACALFIIGGAIWYTRRSLLPTNESNKLFASVNPEYVSTVYVPDDWEVPRANIELVKELGQGSFGMVYQGIARNIVKGQTETLCAIKTVNEHATVREREEFLNEASVMKAFDTYHVVRLLGVVSRGQPTLVVMELMEQGDLKSYLRSHRPDADNANANIAPDARSPPTLLRIQQMAIEIADGMAYLSAKKFVHRDLAARNCMVAGDLTVKVGDFGMTRDIYETDYYRKGSKGLLPVRWMSPESLKDGVFSSNSDVWSYGVVIWEMATLAMQPYQGLSNEQVLRYVVEGGVMERPELCPDRLYDLMRACWAHRPSGRPSFLEIVAKLMPTAPQYFRHRSFFHTPQGQELYSHKNNTLDEEAAGTEVNVGAVATGSGSNLFGVSGRLASWVRELSSLRSLEDDAAAEPLAPAAAAAAAILLKPHSGRGRGPNGLLAYEEPATSGC